MNEPAACAQCAHEAYRCPWCWTHDPERHVEDCPLLAWRKHDEQRP